MLSVDLDRGLVKELSKKYLSRNIMVRPKIPRYFFFAAIVLIGRRGHARSPRFKEKVRTSRVEEDRMGRAFP